MRYDGFEDIKDILSLKTTLQRYDYEIWRGNQLDSFKKNDNIFHKLKQSIKNMKLLITLFSFSIIKKCRDLVRNI